MIDHARDEVLDFRCQGLPGGQLQKLLTQAVTLWLEAPQIGAPTQTSATCTTGAAIRAPTWAVLEGDESPAHPKPHRLRRRHGRLSALPWARATSSSAASAWTRGWGALHGRPNSYSGEETGKSWGYWAASVAQALRNGAASRGTKVPGAR